MDIPLLDIQDDQLWHKDGSLTLMYAFEPLHEPSMTDEDFDAAALAAENVWSSLPENTSYQFIVLVDERRGLEHLQAAIPPIPATSATNRLLEEFRQARYDELVRVRAETDALTIQQRPHYFAATFRPAILRTSLTRETLLRLRELVRGVPGLNKVVPEDARYAPGRGGRFETAYDRIMNEAVWFHCRLQSALDQQDLRPRRCTTGELVSLMHELLNPTASDYLQLDNISQRSRTEQGGFQRSIVDEYPFLGDVPPAWSLLDDDMVVHHRHLQVGDRYVTVLNLKELPDTTEPGVLVPLMQLPREKYRLVYRISRYEADVRYEEPGTGSYDSEDGVLMFADETDTTVERTINRPLYVEVEYEGVQPDTFRIASSSVSGGDIAIDSVSDEGWPHK